MRLRPIHALPLLAALMVMTSCILPAPEPGRGREREREHERMPERHMAERDLPR